MKKIILAAALVLGFAVAASAQPRAIGVRIGNGGEVSYQHSLGSNFLEVDGGLGLGFDGTFNVGATYALWADHFNFLIELQKGKYISAGLVYKVNLKGGNRWKSKLFDY